VKPQFGICMPGGKGEQEIQDDLVVWRWQQTLENRRCTLPRLSETTRNTSNVLRLPGVDPHNRVLLISSSPRHFREIGGLCLGQR
jgi:acyl-coenzyme A synthetase/AMP-(fatty) acid ligase